MNVGNNLKLCNIKLIIIVNIGVMFKFKYVRIFIVILFKFFVKFLIFCRNLILNMLLMV